MNQVPTSRLARYRAAFAETLTSNRGLARDERHIALDPLDVGLVVIASLILRVVQYVFLDIMAGAPPFSLTPSVIVITLLGDALMLVAGAGVAVLAGRRDRVGVMVFGLAAVTIIMIVIETVLTFVIESQGALLGATLFMIFVVTRNATRMGVGKSIISTIAIAAFGIGAALILLYSIPGIL